MQEVPGGQLQRWEMPPIQTSLLCPSGCNCFSNILSWRLRLTLTLSLYVHLASSLHVKNSNGALKSRRITGLLRLVGVGVVPDS